MVVFKYLVVITTLFFVGQFYTIPIFESVVAEAKEINTGKIKIGSKGDELLFETTEISAKPNQAVKLTFHNSANKTTGLQHNWVLVKIGTIDKVIQAGIAAGAEAGYIPRSRDVLAHTKLLNPGEYETIEFTAPSEPGDYPFICTFPGHSTSMRGRLKVE